MRVGLTTFGEWIKSEGRITNVSLVIEEWGRIKYVLLVN